jgi:hypothetical protein
MELTTCNGHEFDITTEWADYRIGYFHLDFARAYRLPQQPCIETDSRDGFRLTDPIQPGPLELEYRERCRRWMEAKRKILLV